jgi:hypothetical protein
MRRILSSGFLLLGLPFFAFAQHAGGMGSASVGGGMHATPMAAPAGAIHSAPMMSRSAAPQHTMVGSRSVNHVAGSNMRAAVPHRTWHPGAPTSPVRYHTTSPANPVARDGRFANDNGFPVPGLGFDYPHFFATHPNFGRTHRTNGFILPFFGGGIYVPYPYYAEPPSYDEQAAEYSPTDAQDNQGESTDRDAEQPARETSVRANYTPPPQAQPEYIFVRRDGTVFFAVAFTWSKDKLQYVTKEGLRRSVALDSLDFAATQQFNDQRGIAIRLPA